MKTTAYGREIYVFVPETHRWLSTLYAAMHKGQLPVKELQLFDGVLRISFKRNDDTLLVILCEKKNAGVRTWRSTKRFNLSFVGRVQLQDEDTRHLGILHRIISKFDPVMPEPLVGPAYIGVPDENPVRALSTMFPFLTVEQSEVRGVQSIEVLLRMTPSCNQRCPFCSGPMHEGPTPSLVRECLTVVNALLPGATLTFTGGEPTLRRSFMEDVSFAVTLKNIEGIQIQTNGVRFAKDLNPADIQPSNKLTFFVSLHAMVESIYDRCVGTAGQFNDALRGIQRIIDVGHRVILNTVICTENLSHLADFVEAVATRFGETQRLRLHFSVLICQEWNSRAGEYLVKYRNIVDVLENVSGKMTRLGFSVAEHFSSTHAAVPPCFFGVFTRGALRRKTHVDLVATGYEDYSKSWIKSTRCKDCIESPRCLGVPRPYAQKFGLAELKPFSRQVESNSG